MDLSKVSENPAVSGGDGGKSSANLVYILYIVGFFTGITALIGVIMAYVNRSQSDEPFKSHFNFQIKIFWRGVIFMAVIFVASLVASTLGVMTLGIGFLLEIVPVGLGIWWLVWTIMSIVKGMSALGRHTRIPA